MDSLSIYSSDLINELDLRFPHRCPSIGDTEREIWMYAGKRALIDDLQILYKRMLEEGTILSK